MNSRPDEFSGHGEEPETVTILGRSCSFEFSSSFIPIHHIAIIISGDGSCRETHKYIFVANNNENNSKILSEVNFLRR